MTRVPLIPLPTIRQRSDHDCGVALTESILFWAGKRPDRRHLEAALLTTRRHGTEPADVAAVLCAAGLKAEVHYDFDPAELREALDAGNPVGLCVTPDTVGHWIGAVGCSRQSLFALDPWTGRVERWDWKNFLRAWHDKDRRGRVLTRPAVLVS